MHNVSLTATFAGAILGFFRGGFWYGPLFGKAWMAEQGWSSEKMEELKKSFNPLKIYGGTFVLGLVASYAFGWLIGPQPPLAYAIGAGLLVGAFCVSFGLLSTYLWEGKSFRLMLINGGYHTIRFAVLGLAFGLLH